MLCDDLLDELLTDAKGATMQAENPEVKLTAASSLHFAAGALTPV
jgi:hypothetical protein